MLNFFRSIYINPYAYYFTGLLAVAGVLSYFIPPLFFLANIGLLVFLTLIFVDILLLFIPNKPLKGKRLLPKKLSNGDQNIIRVNILNHYRFPIKIELVEELPKQFQIRNFQFHYRLKVNEKKQYNYQLQPVERGVYDFGFMNVYVKSFLHLVERRFRLENQSNQVACYPSFKNMSQYELYAIQNRDRLGNKKVRKIGLSKEFEQINNYVLGDDFRHLNWKATAKSGQLMVNHYQEEKSQPFYSIIDTGRVMHMPFDGLSLLDYAINAALVLSNIAVRKQDLAGLLTFSKNVEQYVGASNRSTQMSNIQETLYKTQPNNLESDFGKLYTYVKSRITHRTLLFLYTNFESLDALDRQLSYLRALNKQHVLVVVLFNNTELDSFINDKANKIKDIYDQTLAAKFKYDKRLIVKKLNAFGIFTILSNPKDLTINAINQYLEIKSRGLV